MEETITYENLDPTPEGLTQALEHFSRIKSFQTEMYTQISALWIQRSLSIALSICDEFGKKDQSESLIRLRRNLERTAEDPLRLLGLSQNKVFEADQSLYLEIQDRVLFLKQNGLQGNLYIPSREELNKTATELRQKLLDDTDNLPVDVATYLKQAFLDIRTSTFNELAEGTDLTEAEIIDEQLSNCVDRLTTYCYEILKTHLFSISGNYSFMMREKAGFSEGSLEITLASTDEQRRVNADRLLELVLWNHPLTINRIFQVRRWKVDTAEGAKWVETTDFFLPDTGLDQNRIIDFELVILE